MFAFFFLFRFYRTVPQIQQKPWATLSDGTRSEGTRTRGTWIQLAQTRGTWAWDLGLGAWEVLGVELPGSCGLGPEAWGPQPGAGPWGSAWGIGLGGLLPWAGMGHWAWA